MGFGMLALTISFVTAEILSDPDTSWFAIVCCAFIAWAAICIMIEGETRIDPERQIVEREGRLFGKIRVQSKRKPLSDFWAVEMRYWEDTDSSTVRLGLRPHRGRLWNVMIFDGASGSRHDQAEDYAKHIAQITKLPIQRYSWEPPGAAFPPKPRLQK